MASTCIGTDWRCLLVALLLSDQSVSGDEAQFVASFANPHGAEAVPNLPARWNILRGFKQNALEPPKPNHTQQVGRKAPQEILSAAWAEVHWPRSNVY